VTQLDLPTKIVIVIAGLAALAGTLVVLGCILYSAARIFSRGWHRGRADMLEGYYKDKCRHEDSQESDDVEQEIHDA
jgi:hypothetical protein